MKKTIEAFGTGASAEEALLNAEKELNAPENADVTREVVDIQEKHLLLKALKKTVLFRIISKIFLKDLISTT